MAYTARERAIREKPNTQAESLARQLSSDGESTEKALLSIAGQLARELRPRQHVRRAGVDSSLERDWGFDSLSRAELFLRVERAFGATLPEQLLGDAETLRDVLRALSSAATSPSSDELPVHAVGAEPAEAAPFDVQTLTEALDWHRSTRPDRCHLVILHGDQGERRLTYRDLAEGARRVALGLREADVSPGDRVAIMLPTGEAFFLAFYGALYAGAVPVPIYPPARPAQLEEHMRRQAGILMNAGAVTLITDQVARTAARLLRLQVESLRGVQTIEELATAEGPLPKVAAQDIALLQYTSGSTGDPKGVVLTHANLLANIRAMGDAIGVRASDVFVSWLPLYHDMGLIGAWLGSLYYGVPLIVMSPLRFLVRPERWLWAVHQFRGTLSAAPNFAFELCLRRVEDKAIAGLDLSSLRMVANGSEPVSAITIRKFSDRFKPYGFRENAMAPVYGLAENAVGLAFPPPGRAPEVDRIDRRMLIKRGRAVPAEPDALDAIECVACGCPLAGHQVRILGSTGEMGEREEGHLQFRGPSATSGYFENPGKNCELFDGEWLNSGDLAYIAGADVFITGRSKDIIIRAGRHLYPQELEEAVSEVEGIRKGCVVVFGMNDPVAGTERVVVVAETRERDPERLKDLRWHISEVATHLLQAAPDEILLAAPQTVPKTSSGKLRRAEARRLYEQGELGGKHSAVWRQLVRLALTGLVPQFRAVRRTINESAYAGYWWTTVGLLGAIAWPTVLVLPTRPSRWAALRRIARMALRLLGIAVSVKTEAELPKNAVLVANHASYLDSLILAAALPGELTFVAKKELAGQHIAGPFLRALGGVFVERTDPIGGVETTRDVLSTSRVRGGWLVFFPEGTFTRAPGLLPFHLGAFSIAAQQLLPVVPIAVKGTRSILRGEQWFPRRGTVQIHVGAAIHPRGGDFTEAVRLRDAARSAILKRCGEPDTINT